MSPGPAACAALRGAVSQRAETDLAHGRLADLEVGEPVGRDQDLGAVVVHQGQQLRLAGERVGHGTLDLLGRLPALQGDLAGRVLHADLDLHGYVPPTVSWGARPAALYAAHPSRA